MLLQICVTGPFCGDQVCGASLCPAEHPPEDLPSYLTAWSQLVMVLCLHLHLGNKPEAGGLASHSPCPALASVSQLGLELLSPVPCVLLTAGPGSRRVTALQCLAFCQYNRNILPCCDFRQPPASGILGL